MALAQQPDELFWFVSLLLHLEDLLIQILSLSLGQFFRRRSDEYTRQCLAIYPTWYIRANDVIEVVTDAMKNYFQPEYFRSDNRPEFIAYANKDWL